MQKCSKEELDFDQFEPEPFHEDSFLRLMSSSAADVGASFDSKDRRKNSISLDPQQKEPVEAGLLDLRSRSDPAQSDASWG